MPGLESEKKEVVNESKFLGEKTQTVLAPVDYFKLKMQTIYCPVSYKYEMKSMYRVVGE